MQYTRKVSYRYFTVSSVYIIRRRISFIGLEFRFPQHETYSRQTLTARTGQVISPACDHGALFSHGIVHTCAIMAAVARWAVDNDVHNHGACASACPRRTAPCACSRAQGALVSIAGGSLTHIAGLHVLLPQSHHFAGCRPLLAHTHVPTCTCIRTEEKMPRPALSWFLWSHTTTQLGSRLPRLLRG